MAALQGVVQDTARPTEHALVLLAPLGLDASAAASGLPAERATYVLGLCATLLAIALLGRRLIARLGWAADPHGRFRRILGVVFIVVGIGIALGWDRSLQAWILEHSPIAPWELDSGFIPEG